jgi:hypothetical protein
LCRRNRGLLLRPAGDVAMRVGATGPHFGVVAAAIVQQMADNAPHTGAVHGIIKVPPVTPRADEAGLFQGCQMKRQARCGKVQGAPDVTRGKAGIARTDQMAHQCQTLGVGEGLQGDEGFTLIHASTIQVWLKYP